VSGDRPTAPLVGLVTKDEAPTEVREVFEGGEAQYGRLLHTWQALAQRPEIFVAYLPYLRSIVGPGELEQRVKELVEVRTVVLNRCLYSTSHRVRSARAQGVPEEDLVAVARGDLDGFSEAERTALELCEELTLRPPDVPYAQAPQLVDGGLLERVRASFTEPQIVELVATIGLWNALARFHRVMGFDLDMDPPPDAIAAEL
jgi:alkylhydroperoxidase family enzyme